MKRSVEQYSGETLINVKVDVEDAMRLLANLNGNKKAMRRRILSGIGTSVKQAVKKSYPALLNKRSKTLYKSVTAKIFKSGEAVKISPRAERNNILYGYALAKGSTIKAREDEYLTFKVGDKWVKRKQIRLNPVDWIEGPAKRYLSSSAYKQRINELVEKEILRAEKAAAKKAAKA